MNLMFLMTWITQIAHLYQMNQLIQTNHLYLKIYLNRYYQLFQLYLRNLRNLRNRLYQKYRQYLMYPMFLMLMMCR